MKDEVTITRHQLARKCSEAVCELIDPEEHPGSSMHLVTILSIFSGLIVAKVFEDDYCSDGERRCEE